jgi:hypothetical protein
MRHLTQETMIKRWCILPASAHADRDIGGTVENLWTGGANPVEKLSPKKFVVRRCCGNSRSLRCEPVFATRFA